VPPHKLRELAGSARQQLAAIYQAQGRLAQAESQWRALLAEWPEDKSAWRGLGELCLQTGRWADLDGVVGRLQALPGARSEAQVLQARACLARQDYPKARALAEELLAEQPAALPARVLLSHVLLRQGDFVAAEQALRDVLALAPEHAEARHNLALVLRRRSG
jgi:tetratricopeptide (TPR) repeat protein